MTDTLKGPLLKCVICCSQTTMRFVTQVSFVLHRISFNLTAVTSGLRVWWQEEGIGDMWFTRFLLFFKGPILYSFLTNLYRFLKLKHQSDPSQYHVCIRLFFNPGSFCVYSFKCRWLWLATPPSGSACGHLGSLSNVYNEHILRCSWNRHLSWG